MAARVRWRGKTAERGYGYSHVKIRNALLARWKPGDLCARCGLPMWHRWIRPPVNGRSGISAIDLGHTPDRTAYTGLEHRSCNRGEGARRGNAQRGMRKAWRTSRQWLWRARWLLANRRPQSWRLQAVTSVRHGPPDHPGPPCARTALRPPTSL